MRCRVTIVPILPLLQQIQPQTGAIELYLVLWIWGVRLVFIMIQWWWIYSTINWAASCLRYGAVFFANSTSTTTIAAAASTAAAATTMPLPLPTIPNTTIVDDWRCTCGSNVSGKKKRCGNCNKWRNGKRGPMKKKTPATATTTPPTNSTPALNLPFFSATPYTEIRAICFV